MNWAESIKELRSKMLLTQEELAKKLDVSFASVNRWENGEHEPTMKVKRELMKLMKKYKVVEEQFHEYGKTTARATSQIKN